MNNCPESQEVLLLALRAGKILLENGAEIFRVEDTVYRICRQWGLHSASAFVLSNGIFLTCGDETEPQFSRVLQIPVNNANLNRVALVNELSRRIGEGRCTLEEARQELARIEHLPGFPRSLQITAAGVAAFCFSYMLGGNLRDCICTIFIGLLLQFYMITLGRPRFSKMVCHILGGAWVTVLSILFYRLSLGEHLQPMMTGGIVLMVPGMAFTNGIRDIANGDYISGSVRMLDAILVFVCIAMGVGFVMALNQLLTGGVLL